jgi:hypothetical protein
MKPIDLLKKAARPLGVHTVATPELVPEGPDVAEQDVLASQVQYVAELSGDEMDEFTQIWFGIREKYLSESETIAADYRRCAVAFAWCDLQRNRFNEDLRSVWEVACQLAEHPSTLTTRLFHVANGANAFSGLDDETKKNSKVQSQSPMNVDGSGD